MVQKGAFKCLCNGLRVSTDSPISDISPNAISFTYQNEMHKIKVLCLDGIEAILLCG